MQDSSLGPLSTLCKSLLCQVFARFNKFLSRHCLGKQDGWDRDEVVLVDEFLGIDEIELLLIRILFICE